MQSDKVLADNSFFPENLFPNIFLLQYRSILNAMLSKIDYDLRHAEGPGACDPAADAFNDHCSLGKSYMDQNISATMVSLLRNRKICQSLETNIKSYLR